MKFASSFAGLATLALALAACGDDSAAAADAAPPVIDAPPGACLVDGAPLNVAICNEADNHSDLAWIQANVFTKNCHGMGCHEAEASMAEDLHLIDGQAWTDLVNVPSKQVPSLMRVLPGDCENSYLVQKINDGCLVASGKHPMPWVNGWQPLCQQKRDAICRWIKAGAPPDVDAGVPDAAP